jgi:hypothetical protein
MRALGAFCAMRGKLPDLVDAVRYLEGEGRAAAAVEREVGHVLEALRDEAAPAQAPEKDEAAPTKAAARKRTKGSERPRPTRPAFEPAIPPSAGRVNILVSREGDGYRMALTGDAGVYRSTLSLTPAALDHLTATAHALLRELCQADLNGARPYSGLDIPGNVHQEALNTLAEIGADLYDALFYQGDDGGRQIGDLLRAYAERGSLDITVVARHFAFPWLLLYDKDRTEGVDPEGFWGLHHQIELLPELATPSLSSESVIRARGPLPLTFVANPALDELFGAGLVAAQREFFESMHSQVALTMRTSSSELFADLNDPNLAAQIVYLYCGVAIGERDRTDDGGNDALLIDDANVDNGISLDNPQVRAGLSFQFRAAPLVFLNAVYGQVSPALYGQLVPYLNQKGARGVVGTEVEAPPLFAAEFARRFFQRFLGGQPLGELVLELRREFVARHSNVLGLLYAQYASGDIAVRREDRMSAA